MSKNNGNKNQPQQHQLSPKKYIMTKARSLPLYKCLINNNWKEELLAQVVVTRKHTNGNLTGAIFIVDLIDRGLEDTAVVFNKPEEEFFEVLNKEVAGYEFEETSYEFVHNMVYQGIEHGEDMGYNPMKKLDLGAYILEEDTQEIDFIYIPFGEEANQELINNTDLDKFYSFGETEWKSFFDELDEDITEASPFLDPFFEFVVQAKFPEVKNIMRPFSVKELDIRPDAEMMELYTADPEVRKITDTFLSNLNEEETDFDEFEREMIKNVENHPENPLLKSFLATVVLQNDDTERFRELHEEILEEFPDYSHSKIMLSLMLLDENNVPEFEKLMPPPFTPAAVFPGKNVYFQSEILALISAVLRYAVLTDNLKLALIFEEILEDFALLVEDIFVLQSNDILESALEEYNAYKVEVCTYYLNNELN